MLAHSRFDCEFTQLGAAPREHIAAIDAASGAATVWNPGADGAVNAIAIAGDAVIAGGKFANIGGAVRARLGALDAVSGAATSWTAEPDGAVRTLAVYDDALHVSGDFLTISGASRSQVAAYDATFTLLDTVPNRPSTWLAEPAQ